MRARTRLIAACATLLCETAAWAQANLVDVIEFYNAGLDHYFVSSLAADIQALDSGRFAGWARTGFTFKAYDGPMAGMSPVCRFYIPPAQGDSHFYSASPAECADVRTKFPTFDYESPAVMYVGLPDPTTGACAAGLAPVYRLWNQRVDSNHRYTTDFNVRASMIAKGYLPEGYGPDGVAMCAVPSTTSFDVTVSPSSALLLPGGGRDVYVIVTPHGSTVGQVSITATGIPDDVSGQIAASTLDVGPSATATILHIAASASAAPTALPAAISLSATDSGGTVVSANLSLTIGAAGDPVATNLAAIAAVEAYAMTPVVQAMSQVNQVQAVAAFMSSRPEYADSGVDLDMLNAWGDFKDGSGHIFAFDRTPVAGGTASTLRKGYAKDGAALSDTPRYRLLQSFASEDAQSPIYEMANYFDATGWTGTVGATAGVDALKQVGGDGFFYFNTHAGRKELTVSGVEPEDKIYAIQSSTVVSQDLNTRYADDLGALRLMEMTASQGTVDVPGQGQVELKDTRYAITYRFVQSYMSFAPNSVVMVNACWSSLNERFRNTMLGKGAGVYLGWSDKLSPQGVAKASPYLVDRMLGANMNPDKESPPQRAFPYDQVLTDMHKKGLDTDTHGGGKGPAVLGAFENAALGHKTIFAPSIRRVWVQEADGTLNLEGDFTSDQSQAPKVTVGGSGLAVIDWAPDLIRAQLPGPTTSGDVIVEIRGVRSNARQLTEWSVPVTYTWNPALFQGFKMQGNGTIRLRADIAGYRTEPAGMLTYLYTGGLTTQDSSLQITGSGSYDQGGGCTATLSGTRNFVTILSGGIPQTILGAFFGIDGNLRQGALSITLGATALAGYFVETYSGNCSTPPDSFVAAVGVQDGAVSVPSDPSDNPQTLALPQGLRLQLDANYGIAPVNRGSLPAPGVQNGGMVVYSWPLVPANAPPRDTDDSGK